jgi:hypothetical protein
LFILHHDWSPEQTKDSGSMIRHLSGMHIVSFNYFSRRYCKKCMLTLIEGLWSKVQAWWVKML